MSKRQKQVTLLDTWTSSPSPSKKQERVDVESGSESEIDTSETTHSDLPSTSDSYPESSQSERESCHSLCCSSESKPFQPTTKETLQQLTRNGRKFLPIWYSQYPWLTVCTTKKKVFCFYCKHATVRKLVQFSKNSNPAFTDTGFNNWKKAHQKFTNHSVSHTHKEAKMKWLAFGKASLSQQFNAQITRSQASRRKALLYQLSAIRFLLRQGLALRGHTEMEGNLRQLLG